MRREWVFVLVIFVCLVIWRTSRGPYTLPRIVLEDDVVLPESDAQMCLFFVSCNRSKLLEQTVASVEVCCCFREKGCFLLIPRKQKHLRLFEPSLKTELVLIDQGTTARSRRALASKHNFATMV